MMLFSFPFKDEKRIAAWTAVLNRSNWTPTKSSKVCSKHFVLSDYLDRPGGYVKHLKSNAVPSMNLSNTVCKQKRQMKEGNDSSNSIRDQINDLLRIENVRNTTIVKNIGNLYTTELRETSCSEQRSDKMSIEFLSDQEYEGEDENMYSDNLEDNVTKPSYKELSRKICMLQQEICRKDKIINSLKQILEELAK